MPAFGFYLGRPVGGKLVKASTGTDTFCVDFKVDKCAAGAEWVPTTEVIDAKIDLYMSDGAIGITNQHLQTWGFNGDFANPAFDTADVTVEYKPGEGKFPAKWQLPRPERAEADTDTVRKYNAMWRNQFGSVKQPPKAPENKAAPVSP